MSIAADRIGAGRLWNGVVRFRTGAAGAALDVFAIRIAAAGFAYVAQVLMARLMGGTEYGIFAALWVWIAILGHSATLGLSQGACRFLPADQARGDEAGVRAYLLGGLAVTLSAAVAVAVAGLALVWAEGSLLAGPYAAPLLVAALVLPLFALQDYCEGIARSQNWAVLAIAPPYLLRQGLVMAAMLIAVGLGAPAEARVAVLCTLIATGVAVALQAGLLAMRLRRLLPPGPRRYAWRRWWRACLPIAASDLASAGFNFVDVVVLSLLASPATVGLYFAATRIQQFVVFVHFAATAATAQRFTAAHAAGDGAGLDALVRMQARLTLGATILVGVAVLAAAPLLLGLFGPEFRDSLPILAVLVAGSICASAFGPGEDLLNMLGGERLAALVTVLMLGLAAILCVALVPVLGVLGAALGMAVATTVRAVAMAGVAKSVHGLTTPVRFPLDGSECPMIAAATGTTTSAYRAAILTLAELGAEARAWDALSRRAGRTHPYYGRQVMQAHAVAGLASPGLSILVVRGAEGLEAVLPFRMSYDICGLGRPVALPFVSPFVTGTAPLVAAGPERPAILAVLVEGLRAASGGRPWRWPLLSRDTDPGRDLLAALRAAGWECGEVACFERPVLDRRADHDAFLDGHPHRSRLKDLRRRQRRLAEGGDVAFEVAAQGPRLAAAVEAFLTLEAAGWKGEAGSAMACSPSHAAFARAVFAGSEGPVAVRADTLSRDGRPLAISLALVSGGTAFLLKTAYDEGARALAPGLVLEAEIVRALHADAFAEHLDAATTDASALESLYREREAVAEIVAVPGGMRHFVSLDRRLRLARLEREARGEAKRLLGRRTGTSA